MAGEDKPFPPSDYKLSQLRRAGIIAYSPLLTASALIVGLLAGINLVIPSVAGNLAKMLSKSAASAGTMTSAEIKAEWFATGEFLFTAVGEMLLIGVAIVLLVGFVQSRFYFSPSNALPNFGRLFRLQPSAALIPARRTFRILPLVLLWLAIVIAFGMRLTSAPLPLFPQLAFSEKQGLFLHGTPRSTFAAVADVRDSAASGGLLTHELLATLSPLLWYTAIFFAVVGILSRVIVHVEYLQRHRMTRTELDAELREMEMRPELRRGLRGPVQE